MAVRSPMQWTDAPIGRLLRRRRPPTLCRPLTSQAGFGPDAVNAAAQRRDPDSLLNWFERLIRRRRESHALGHGALRARCPPATRPVFAHRCDWDGRVARRGAQPRRPGGARRARARPRATTCSTCSATATPSWTRTAAWSLDLEPHDHRWYAVAAATPAAGMDAAARSGSGRRRPDDHRLVGRERRRRRPPRRPARGPGPSRRAAAPAPPRPRDRERVLGVSMLTATTTRSPSVVGSHASTSSAVAQHPLVARVSAGAWRRAGPAGAGRVQRRARVVALGRHGELLGVRDDRQPRLPRREAGPRAGHRRALPGHRRPLGIAPVDVHDAVRPARRRRAARAPGPRTGTACRAASSSITSAARARAGPRPPSS